MIVEILVEPEYYLNPGDAVQTAFPFLPPYRLLSFPAQPCRYLSYTAAWYHQKRHLIS